MPTFVEQMATLLNRKFNIPKVPEWMEQTIFEELVGWTAEYIPPEVRQKILDAGDGLSESELDWWTNYLVDQTVAGYIASLPEFLQYFARKAADALRTHIRPWIEYILSFAVVGKSMPLAMAALEQGEDPDGVTTADVEVTPEPAEPEDAPRPLVFTMTDDDGEEETDPIPEGE